MIMYSGMTQLTSQASRLPGATRARPAARLHKHFKELFRSLFRDLKESHLGKTNSLRDLLFRKRISATANVEKTRASVKRSKMRAKDFKQLFTFHRSPIERFQQLLYSTNGSSGKWATQPTCEVSARLV